MTSASRLFEEEPRLKGRKGRDGTVRLNKSYFGRMGSGQYAKHLAGASAGKPEAVVKITKDAPRGYQVRNLMMYTSRLDREGEERAQEAMDPLDKGEGLTLEDNFGRQYQGKEQVHALYEKWSQDFERLKPGQERGPRHVYHIILSAKADGTDPKNLAAFRAAAMETMNNEVGDKGYDFVMGVHKDTEHVHAHFVVRAHHRDKGRPKLRMNKPEIYHLRREFAERLTENGLDHVCTLRRDRDKEKAPEKPDKWERNKWEFEKDLSKKVAHYTDVTQKAFRQHDRAMARDIPARNSVLFHVQAQAVHDAIRKELKEDTRLSESKRKEAFNSLREVRRAYLDRPLSFDEVQRSTSEHFNKQIEKVAGGYAEKTDDPKERSYLKPKEVKAREAALNRWGGNVKDELAKTNDAIEKLPFTEKEKLEIRAMLMDKGRDLAEVERRGQGLGKFEHWINNHKSKEAEVEASINGLRPPENVLAHRTYMQQAYTKAKENAQLDKKMNPAEKEQANNMLDRFKSDFVGRGDLARDTQTTMKYFSESAKNIENGVTELNKNKKKMESREFAGRFRAFDKQFDKLDKEFEQTITAVRNNGQLGMLERRTARKAISTQRQQIMQQGLSLGLGGLGKTR